MTYRQFERIVKNYTNPADFKDNRFKLKRLNIASYDTFIKVLKLGAEITSGIRVCEEIFKISVQTALTENDVVELLTRFRFVNALIDSAQYKKSIKVIEEISDIKEIIKLSKKSKHKLLKMNKALERTYHSEGLTKAELIYQIINLIDSPCQ